MQHSNDQSVGEIKTAGLISVDNSHAVVESPARGGASAVPCPRVTTDATEDGRMPLAFEYIAEGNHDTPNAEPSRARLPTWGDECVPLDHRSGRNPPRPIGCEIRERRAIPGTTVTCPWCDPYLPWGRYSGPNPPRSIAREMLNGW
ncbi:hypothetical protein TRAPUB_4347 [Trametes pubescens]|uniref:Uncharacterized protein n=1 Tax=Trametes pubescens TaxID=154538 RepID=A0A1M2VBJ4_TRAPU|nr:hypothetical protein TRAPUB_4347 [Trametes pubescens]